ncbi:MAG: alpha/beta fold hydrolase [Saprospiraceae bacterium]|nr:alpha/beta fold hydrolase [Saprospiraceae bacterium]
MKILKWIGYLLVTAVVVLGLYIGYFLRFHRDIPKTIANANDQSLDASALKRSLLTNRWGDTMAVDQGYLVVPENRSDPSGNRIRIGFLRIPTASPTPSSPIYFLAGGPGTPVSSVAKGDYFYLFQKLSSFAEVVLIDQRGTGTSVPNLRCRNPLSLPTGKAQDWERALLDDVRKKCRECAEEFQAMGIDMSAYNSSESARDIESIRLLLGQDRISLFGYSYGSELAQHYLAHHEDKVDRLVLAGISAPDLSLKLPAEMETQYQAMDSLIAADIRLRKYIPHFTDLMSRVNAQLDDHPLRMQLPLMDAVGSGDGALQRSIFKIISWFKPYWKLTLSATHLRMMMAQNAGTSSWTQIAPAYYYQLAHGEYQRLGNYLRNFRRQGMPNAIFFTVNAATSYPNNRWKLATEPRPQALVTHFDISFARYPDVMGQFGVQRQPGLDQPVASTRPALLIGGTLDGRTPLSNLDSLARRFSHSQKIIVVNASHNDLVDHAVLEYIIQFLRGQRVGDLVLQRLFSFVPPIPYRFSMSAALDSIRLVQGIDAALRYHKQLFEKYRNQDDYYYDVSENSLNGYGYQLLEQQHIEDAIAVFRQNADLFPDAYNVYNSLAEGLIARGDHEAAIINLQKAVKLNPLDGYSQAMLQRLTGGNTRQTTPIPRTRIN